MTKKIPYLPKVPDSGFTLLEVLIALAIFAMVSVICYKQIDTSFRTSERIEQKYLALWVAENKLEEFFVERQWPMLGETKSNVEMLSLRWAVKTDVSESEIKNLRKIDVSVFIEDDHSESPVLTLTRYIGKD